MSKETQTQLSDLNITELEPVRFIDPYSDFGFKYIFGKAPPRFSDYVPQWYI